MRFIVLFIKVKGPKEAKAGISAEDEEEIKRRAIEEYLAKQSAAANASSQGSEPEKDAPVEEKTEDGASDETVEELEAEASVEEPETSDVDESTKDDSKTE